MTYKYLFDKILQEGIKGENMNKKEFIDELSNKTGLSKEKCTEINSIIEDTFLIGKKNKEKMISGFTQKLGIDEQEANKVYETAMQIITNSMKEKLKHPFKNQD